MFFCPFALDVITVRDGEKVAAAGETCAAPGALLTLAINFRYAMYGVSMLGRWKTVPLLKKLFLIHTLTDENYALEVACRLEPPAAHLAYCVTLSALNLSYWVTGVAVGAATGSALPIPSEGIEYAMTALFLVILTDQVRTFFGERRRGR